MKKKKQKKLTKTEIKQLAKTEIEILLRDTHNVLGIDEEFDFKVYRRKKKNEGLPDRTILSIDVDLAHRLYNWAHWNNVPKHKALDHFLVKCVNAKLRNQEDRPINSDSFAQRYYAERFNKKAPKKKEK